MQNTPYTDLWFSLTEKSKNLETKMDALTRKRTGSYYTDLAFTDILMRELVNYLQEKNPEKKISEYRFLEPCVGAGNFVFSYIKAAKETGLNKKEAEQLFQNIYVADVNQDSLKGYQESLQQIAMAFWKIRLSEEYFQKHIGTALLFDVTAEELKYIAIQEVFSEEFVKEGFDIIATNPPYKNLKAERGQYDREEEYQKDKKRYSVISKIMQGHFFYITEGGLNLYKLFMEEIINRYAGKNAVLSLLVPSSILSDKMCEKLRTYLLKELKMVSVKVIKEGCGYIDAKQALSSIFLQKGEKTEKITVVKDFCNYPKEQVNIDVCDIFNSYTKNAIFAVSSNEYKILKQLRQFPTVGEIPYISNLRGELDLTINKHSIVQTDTGYPLLRGRNIGYYQLNDGREQEFVLEEFICSTKKNRYINKERIVCQQIANMKKERRVTFSLVQKNYVLGNSCNFISVEENPYGIDCYALLGLFNTKIIDWLFRLTSSNNHINNYEIDCFPIPIEAPELKKISVLVKKYLAEPRKEIIQEIEKLAQMAYQIKEMAV